MSTRPSPLLPAARFRGRGPAPGATPPDGTATASAGGVDWARRRTFAVAAGIALLAAGAFITWTAMRLGGTHIKAAHAG